MRREAGTPKFTLACIHCGTRLEVPVEEVEIEEGRTIWGICPKCIELGLPVPKGWEKLD